ncbi:MAG: hypothetical protein WB473_06965, partial [Pedococcus sp.]
APGQWSVPITMTESGPASTVVTVTRAGMGPTVLPVDWVVAQAVPAVPVVSLAPVRGWLQAAAAALAVVLALAWAVGAGQWWRRRGQRRRLLVAALGASDLRAPDRSGLGVRLR